MYLVMYLIMLNHIYSNIWPCFANRFCQGTAMTASGRSLWRSSAAVKTWAMPVFNASGASSNSMVNWVNSKRPSALDHSLWPFGPSRTFEDISSGVSLNMARIFLMIFKWKFWGLPTTGALHGPRGSVDNHHVVKVRFFFLLKAVSVLYITNICILDNYNVYIYTYIYIIIYIHRIHDN